MASYVQIGDIHLVEGSRLQDRLDAFDHIIDEGATVKDLAGWWIPGDLFHIKSTIIVRNALRDRVQRMARYAPVLIGYGNHDVDGDLDIFGDLRSSYPIQVISYPQVVHWPDIDIFVLPYPTPAGLIAGGIAQSDVPAASREALDALFMAAGTDLQTARATGRHTAMLGHAAVAGAVASIGQPQIGAEIEIDGAMLARLGPGYKGLNHIHIAQEVAGAYYAGSVCRLSWGEVEPKSYLVIEYGDQTDAHTVTRRPIDVAPMWHLEADLTRDGLVNIRPVMGPDGKVPELPPGVEAPNPDATYAGCEVRLRGRYKPSEKAILAEAIGAARKRFALAKRYEFEPICEPDRAVRAPELIAARSLQEKVAVWATVTGAVVPETAATVLGDLQVREGATIIADVKHRMEAILHPELVEEPS